MQKSNTFLKQILQKIERIDKESLKQCVRDLAEETELLRLVIDNLSEGVVIADAKGRVELINAQAASLLGLYGGASKTQCLTTLEDEHARAYFLEILPGLKNQVAADLHLLAPRENFVRVMTMPFNGSKDGRVLVVLLNRSQEMEEQFDVARIARIEALIKLAAGVAHEIGNPLNSLSIHLQLLKKEVGKLPAEKRKGLEKSLEVIGAETNRLDRIVRNFLKATRKPALRFKHEDINRVMEEAINFLRPELKENGIDITFQRDEKMPHFYLDRDRIYQVFLNLIKNGMESMAGRRGKIKIRIRGQDKIALISVHDQGRGISEDDLPHIFDAYYTTKEEGSGLGLMTVYDAVHEHAGRIEVKSKPGSTIFTVMIPMRQPKLQLPEYKIADGRQQNK